MERERKRDNQYLSLTPYMPSINYKKFEMKHELKETQLPALENILRPSSKLSALIFATVRPWEPHMGARF
jgi:hypothetical protein